MGKAKIYWFTLGSTVWNKASKEKGHVVAIRGSVGRKDHKAQVKWESTGLTTWHRNKELSATDPSK